MQHSVKAGKRQHMNMASLSVNNTAAAINTDAAAIS